MQIFDLNGAAEYLNVSTDTMADLAGNGSAPGAKIGKSWVFTDEALNDYLRSEIDLQTAARRKIPASPTKRTRVNTAHSRSVRRRPATLQGA